MAHLHRADLALTRGKASGYFPSLGSLLFFFSLPMDGESSSSPLLSMATTSGGDVQMGVEGSKPNPNPNSRFESEMEGGSKRLGEMELDAARALAEMAEIEVGSDEGGKSSRKRIKKESKARASGDSSHDLNISRSEALREELIKRVADLSLENKNMQVMASAIKSKVECGVGITSRHVDTSTSPSTELSLVAPSRTSITTWDPWPSISSNAAARYEEGGSGGVGASTTLFYVPPCAWFYPLPLQATESYTSCLASTDTAADIIASQHGLGQFPQEGDNSKRASSSLHAGSKTDDLSTETAAPDEEKRNVGINLEEMPIGYDGHDESSEHNASVVLTHSEEAVNPCPGVKGEGVGTVADGMTDQLDTVEAEKSQLASIPPLLVDPSAAAAARKRRKELTKLKYHHWRQIRLHG